MTATETPPNTKSQSWTDRPFLLLIVVALFASCGTMLLWHGSNQASDSNRHRNDAGELELVSIRVQMTRAQLDELTLRLLEPFDLATSADIDAAHEVRVDAVQSGLEALAGLSVLPGPQGDQARQILDAFTEYGPEPSEIELYALYDGADVAQFEAERPPRSPANRIDSITELVWLDQAALFTLHEALVASYDQNPKPANADVVEFFEEFAEFVADEGGYLGPDPESPLIDGWVPVDVAVIHEADTVGAANLALEATTLWQSDQWIRSWANGDLGNPPVRLRSVATNAQQATTDIRDLTDDRLVDQTNASTDLAASASTQARLARTSGLTALTLSFAALTLLGHSLWRRSLHLQHQANIDPLTRVGNRNHLNTETARLVSTPQLNHHAVVMIDMDRFKLINDTHGHSVGDQLLQRLALGLTEIADSSLAEAATVIRLGGDEFALTLHHNQPIDIEQLQLRLNTLRSEHVTTSEQAIVLEFSYGTETATGTPALEELLESADLAAYQQKSSRATDRRTQTDNTAPESIATQVAIKNH